MSRVPDWACAHGPAVIQAAIRVEPADFLVTEQCSIEFSGDGEHDYLWIEKSGNNTHWVAERLAKHAGISARDVGFAGLKDRHAITRQWFSVRRAGAVDWSTFAADGVRVVSQQRHRRKLKRGAHDSNSFRIALRSGEIDANVDLLTDRMQGIRNLGVPNYFGEQRFGHGGGNIDLCRALFSGRRMSRAKRSIALSAARSLLFNSILDDRVRAGSWNRILPGELANLDGSASVFAVDDVDDELAERCKAFDIHPSATLWGENAPRSADGVARLESGIALRYADLAAGLVEARVQASSRALRMAVRNLQWRFDDAVLWLEFELAKGCYATAVLREIAAFEDSRRHGRLPQA